MKMNRQWSIKLHHFHINILDALGFNLAGFSLLTYLPFYFSLEILNMPPFERLLNVPEWSRTISIQDHSNPFISPLLQTLSRETLINPGYNKYCKSLFRQVNDLYNASHSAVKGRADIKLSQSLMSQSLSQIKKKVLFRPRAFFT